MALKMHPSISLHAGRWLMSEVVAPSGRSITDLAAAMGVSRQALSTVLNGHASLSAEMALCFEQQFKISADTLMRTQTAHDLAQARLQFAGWSGWFYFQGLTDAGLAVSALEDSPDPKFR
jgi:antitoxin HigA-1